MPRIGPIAVVFGTRPEIIKLAGVVRLLGTSARLLHTGQHYDATLDELVARDTGLPRPHVTLGIGGASRGQQIGDVTSALDRLFAADPPAAVIVQGDTNAALAGALAANAREIPLVHVEAGLRSHDRAMPEEHNRVVVDHLADLCCAPTKHAAVNLLREGIDEARIAVTGNTVVEAVRQLLPERAERLRTVQRHGLQPGGFVLATLHRPENVDHLEPLAAILAALAQLPLRVVLPLHPRTRSRVQQFALGAMLEPLHVIDPLPPRAFLGLGAEAALWITDSGGLQEEASVLKMRTLVVRRSTERPEVQGTFAELVPPGSTIVDRAQDWLADPQHRSRLRFIPSPYGDGTASAQIVGAMHEFLGIAVPLDAAKPAAGG